MEEAALAFFMEPVDFRAEDFMAIAADFIGGGGATTSSKSAISSGGGGPDFSSNQLIGYP